MATIQNLKHTFSTNLGNGALYAVACRPYSFSTFTVIVTVKTKYTNGLQQLNCLSAHLFTGHHLNTKKRAAFWIWHSLSGNTVTDLKTNGLWQ